MDSVAVFCERKTHAPAGWVEQDPVKLHHATQKGMLPSFNTMGPWSNKTTKRRLSEGLQWSLSALRSSEPESPNTAQMAHQYLKLIYIFFKGPRWGKYR